MTHAALKDLAAAVLAARSHIGASRPDEHDEPEDAKQWDDLTKAAEALSAVEGEAVARVQRSARGPHGVLYAALLPRGPKTPEVKEGDVLYTAPPPQQAAHVRDAQWLEDAAEDVAGMASWQERLNKWKRLAVQWPGWFDRADIDVGGKVLRLTWVEAQIVDGIIARIHEDFGMDALATQPQQAGGDAIDLSHENVHHGLHKLLVHRRHALSPLDIARIERAIEATASTPPQPEAGGGVTEAMVEAAAKRMWETVPRGVPWNKATASRADWLMLARAALSTTPASGGEHG